MLFAALALVALYPALKFRWPSRDEALARLDRNTGLKHRPATALTDTLASTDPVAQALWRAQRERTLAALQGIRAGLPAPRLPKHDPGALRALVAVLLVATFIAAGEERSARVAAAFDWNGALAAPNVRVDAWVTPPVYTNKPPIILSAANKDLAAHSEAALPVPAGSTLLVRSSGGDLDVAVSGGVVEAAPEAAAPSGTSERHFKITGDGTAQVRAPSGQPQWSVQGHHRPRAVDRARQGAGAPGARLAAAVLQARGRLRRHRSARAVRASRRPPPRRRPTRRGRCSSRRNSR